MDLTATLALLAGALALTVLAGWRGARPPDLHRGPRMMPWRFLMLLGAALSMLLLIHLAALAGGGAPPPLY
jgi:hypothetical protein